jgi:hypothetical protein
MKSIVRFDKILCCGYLTVTNAALMLIIYMHYYDSHSARYIIPYIVLLTSPWSLILSVIFNKLGFDSIHIAVISVIVCMAINSSILFVIGKAINNRIRQKNITN